MKVTKRINNNIVACCDDTGREYMAMGRGLGFDALLGDVLVESRVEKIFSIVPAKGYGSIESLFAKLPQERISACIEVIDYAKTVLPTKLNDSLYLTLTDHVNFAINHNCSDQQVGFLLTSEVKLCYPKEYLIGRFALKVFEKRLDVKLPDEEACAIALHIVNAEQLTGIGAVVHITETIKSSRSGPVGPFLSHHRTYRSVYGGSIKYKSQLQTLISAISDISICIHFLRMSFSPYL